MWLGFVLVDNLMLILSAVVLCHIYAAALLRHVNFIKLYKLLYIMMTLINARIPVKAVIGIIEFMC